MMINNIKISLLVSVSLFFIWWFFLTDLQTDKTENFYTRSEFAEDAGTIYYDMGRLSFARNNYASAINSFKKAINVNEYMYGAYDSLGLTYEKMHDADNAIKTYAHAMHINPNFLYFREDSSLLNKPLHYDENVELIHNMQPWKGQSLHERTIYVHYSLGITECLLYVRFLKKLSSMAHTVFFKPPRELLELLQANKQDNVQLIDITTNINELHCHYSVALESLPYLLDITYNDLATLTEPLIQPNQLNDQPALTTASDKKQKIAIIWQQSLHCLEKITLPDMYIFTTLPNTIIYNLSALTKDDHYFLAQHNEKDFISYTVQTSTINKTAQLLNACDIIIGTDSYITHLAALMGKKVYLLLDDQAHWYWFKELEAPAIQGGALHTSPSIWYPSLTKIYRPYKESWHTCLENLKHYIMDQL